MSDGRTDSEGDDRCSFAEVDKWVFNIDFQFIVPIKSPQTEDGSWGPLRQPNVKSNLYYICRMFTLGKFPS